MKFHKLWAVVLATAALTFGALAHAQGSDRPIKLVVPYAPGGAADLVARALGQKVSETLGRSVIIENRPGAGGNIGSGVVATSAPDGTTLLFNGTGPLAISAAAGVPMNFDPEKDLTPIAMVTRVPSLVTVNASLPIHSIQELVAYAKAHPAGLSYGASAVGNLSQLNAEMFKSAAGVAMVGVPYRGSAPLIVDLIAGTVQVSFDNMPIFLPHIKSGKLRVLAVIDSVRSPLLPNVPTLEEAGFKGFNNPAIFAVWGPKSLAPNLVATFNKAFTDAANDPGVLKPLRPQAIEPMTSSPDKLAARMRTDRANFADIIKRAGIKFE